ncbi:MAG: marine proteobacterial sortase target protein, partial [Cellvibrionaceae bacterium]|nr:marine proteobacterial sortase target protein [Cellvibrionaceae bacterium]
AVNFVRGLEAGGGTDMLPALKDALAQEPSPGFIKQVVFITDGSVGNEAQLFAEIHQRLGDARLFTVGIGSAPNGFFMRKAAQFGRGSYSYIGDIGQLKTEMAELFAKLERPVLRDIKVQWPKHLQVEMWPENIPDLYLGEPLRILAKLSDKNASDTMAGKIVIEGDLGGGRWRQSLDLAGAGQKQHPGVATLWGREKIEALLDQKIMGRDEALVRKDVLAVALRQQLLSPYTSFVAVEQKPARPAQQKLTSEAVPNAMPKGNTMAFPSTASLWQAQLLLALLPLLLLWRRRRV